MFTSIKNAFSELEHVVWPTDTESKKYMTITVGTIVAIGAFLSIVGYVLQGSLSGIRGTFPHETQSTSTVSGEEFVTEADIAELQKAAEAKKATEASSGIIIEPLSLTGAQ